MNPLTTRIGDPVCIPVPEAHGGCEVDLQPKPKLSTVLFKKECGVQFQIYQPGLYEVTLSCEKNNQPGEGQTFVSQIDVKTPQELQAELQFRVQPWVDLPGQWGKWTVQGAGWILGALALVLLGRWVWRKWIRRQTHQPVTLPWDPEKFLKRLQALEQDLKQQRQRPRSVAFELTSLFFELSRQAPTAGMRSIFDRAYQESTELFSELKFNPESVETGHPLEKMVMRYTPTLREAVISKHVEAR